MVLSVIHFVGESAGRICIYSLLGGIYIERSLFEWRMTSPPFTLAYDLMILEVIVGFIVNVILQVFLPMKKSFTFFS
jgi:hypothetical protein